MCGHFGIILSHTELPVVSDRLRKYVDNATLAGDLRGGDGCGIIAVTKKEVIIHKKGINASDFRKEPEVIELLKRKDLQALLGHNRKSTFGNISDENSHPFIYGDIYLLHNGTLTGGILKYKEYNVDSEYVADMLNKHLSNPEKALEMITGAYSLVWYNLKTDTINFARNNQRPMFFANTKRGSLVYASEMKMIDWICDRNDIDIIEIVPTIPGEILTFDLEKFMFFKTVTKTKFKPVEEEDFLDYYRGNSYSSRFNTIIKNLPVPNKKQVNMENTTGFCKLCGEYEGRFYLRDELVICETCDKILDLE